MSNGGTQAGRDSGPWSPIIAGAIGGSVGGWISSCILAFCTWHAFESTILAAFVWTGRIAAWYMLGGLLIGVLATAISGLVGRRDAAAAATILQSRRAVGFVGLGATLFLTFGLVLNFAILPRPIHPDFTRIVANAIAVLAGTAMLYAGARFAARTDAHEARRSAWLLLFPLVAACAWTLPLSPDPRLKPDRFVAGDGTACPANTAESLAKRRSGSHANFVLLTIDTLRADHLTPYGYPRATSPFLAKLASESVLFERAFATKASTSTAIASFLTSRLPWAHGVSHPAEVLPDDNLTIAEVLQAAGYKTGAVVENGNVFPLFHYNQGFDDYEYGSFKAADISDRASAWLSRQTDTPFFLWIHYLDPHSPYSPPTPYSSMFVDDPHYVDDPLTGPYPDTFRGATPVDPIQGKHHHMNKSWYIAQYDGEIRYTDAQVARVYDTLERLGRTNDTWLVVSADHGECFGEDNYFGHGELAHDCGLHVPLIVRPPGGVTARRVPDVASMIDIVPTVLEGLGFPESGCFQGRSWLSHLGIRPPRTNAEPLPVLATAGFISHVRGGHQFVLRNERWKFVKRKLDWMFDLRSPTSVLWLWNSLSEGGLADDELYDLDDDPHELRNLIREVPVTARALEDELFDRLGRAGPLHAPATRLSSRKLDTEAPEILENLKVLGYIE